jgi:hypothetical protein
MSSWNTLPAEMKILIVDSFMEDKPSCGVRLYPTTNPPYYFAGSTRREDPIQDVLTRGCDYALLQLNANSGKHDFLASFYYPKDTLYLDIEFRPLILGRYLRPFLNNFHEENIKRVQHLAISIYPAVENNSMASVEGFKADLERFKALKTLELVLQNHPNVNSASGDLKGFMRDRMGDWLARLEEYSEGRGVTVKKNTWIAALRELNSGG